MQDQSAFVSLPLSLSLPFPFLVSPPRKRGKNLWTADYSAMSSIIIEITQHSVHKLTSIDRIFIYFYKCPVVATGMC